MKKNAGEVIMTTLKTPVLIIILALSFFSCKDQGEVPEYVEIISLRPAPNEVNVDKGATIGIGLNRLVNHSESEKVQLRYVGDTATIQSYTGCGHAPPQVNAFCAGPLIWKPGKTVEVVVPKTLTDLEGHSMKEDFVYRFSIASDTIPFQLTTTQPQQNDTISLRSQTRISGSLTFSDYTPMLRDSVLTITPPARIYACAIVSTGARSTPSNFFCFSVENIQPNATYEITIPRRIKDYEGETLPQDYRLVFHTKP